MIFRKASHFTQALYVYKLSSNLEQTNTQELLI